jgi:predicted metal-dependent enzyme (double-stranded beta helix superfamily)
VSVLSRCLTFSSADRTEELFVSAVSEPIESTLLTDIAAGLAAAVPLWQQVAVHDPADRRPVRLLATDRYEVWVIGWLPGQSAELHDHGEAAGTVAVVEGALTEDVVRHGRVVRDTIATGEVLDLPVGIVHEIANTSDERATSIHVYSPPLRTMTRYDRATLAPVLTEIVPWEAPLLASSAARHPSLARG